MARRTLENRLEELDLNFDQKHLFQLHHSLFDVKSEKRSREDFLNRLYFAKDVKFLGAGNFGQVLGLTMDDGRQFAVKIQNEVRGVDMYEANSEAYLGTYLTPSEWRWGYEGDRIPERRLGKAFESRRKDSLLNIADYYNFYVFRDVGSFAGALRGPFAKMAERKDSLSEVIISSGTLYAIEMEMLDSDAESIVRDPKVDFGEAISMLVQVMSTLRGLVRSNVRFVHGDLTTNNIMFSNVDASEEPLEITYRTGLRDRSRGDAMKIYVIIDLGFSNSERVAKNLSGKYSDASLALLQDDDWLKFWREKMVDEKLGHWRGKPESRSEVSPSLDLHTFGISLLFDLGYRLSRSTDAELVIDTPTYYSMVDFVLEHMLHDPEALTDAWIEDPIIKEQEIEDPEIKEQKLVNPRLYLRAFKKKLRAVLDNPNRTPETLIVALTDPIPPEIKPRDDDRPLVATLLHFTSEVETKHRLEFRASTALDSDFRSHPLLKDHQVAIPKRKRGELI